MSCHACSFEGDDGLCFAEEAADCPRGLIEVEDESEEIEDEIAREEA